MIFPRNVNRSRPFSGRIFANTGSAIPKPLADVNFPEGGPLGSLGLAGDPEALRFPPDPYDPERAKKLLAEAGYSKGFHGGKFYTFQEHAGIGEMIATYWEPIGISNFGLTPWKGLPGMLNTTQAK